MAPFTFWTLTLWTPERSYFFSKRSCVASSAFREDAARRTTERAASTGRMRHRFMFVGVPDGVSNIPKLPDRENGEPSWKVSELRMIRPPQGRSPRPDRRAVGRPLDG